MVDVFVLSGGGSRGAYHAGLLQAFDEAGFYPDRIVGTSIGALNGCAFAGGMPMDECVRLWRTLRTRDVVRPRLSIRRPLVPTGLRRILERMDWPAIRGGIPLRVTAIDAPRRRPVVWHNHELDVARLLATAALPPVFAPVEIDGSRYMDGGLWQNPPIDAALDAPVDRLILLCHEPLEGHVEPPALDVRAQSMALSDVIWHARSREALRGLEARRALPRRYPLRVDVKEVHVLAPSRSTIPDILRFDPELSSAAVDAAHADARRWLERL